MENVSEQNYREQLPQIILTFQKKYKKDAVVTPQIIGELFERVYKNFLKIPGLKLPLGRRATAEVLRWPCRLWSTR